MRHQPPANRSRDPRPAPRLQRDALVCLGLGLAAFLVYAQTTAPSVATIFDDSLEFQVVGPTLGIAHPTGYPLYTILLWLVTRLPWHQAAFGANLFSALAAAAAVAGTYASARLLPARPLAAATAAAVLGLSPVWWSQATIAEVYSLHLVLMMGAIWLALRLGHGSRGRLRGRALTALAVAIGLGLAHHRMTLLLLPGLAAYVYVVLGSRELARRLPRLLLAGAAPLLLYLYLPLRGQATSSLDGNYVNTLAGFWEYVTASGYGVFLQGEAPGIASRGLADHWGLFLAQFGHLGLAFAAIGLVALLGRRRLRWLLGISLLVAVAFGVVYRVADYEVFFLPAFALTALVMALGLEWASQALGRLGKRWAWAQTLPALALLLALTPALPLRWLEQDRSANWGVRRQGVQWLEALRPEDTLVGILGETTLMRYLQDVQGEGPGARLVAADDEVLRRETIEWLAERGPTLLTRPLPGLEATYSLTASGDLIRLGEAQPAASGGQEVAPGLMLLRHEIRATADHGRSSVAVHITWTAPQGLERPVKLSVRLMRAGEVIVAQDSQPVHDAYPTTAWRPGEMVADLHRLDLPVGDAGGEVTVALVAYDAETGAVLGQADLGPLTLAPSSGARPLDQWDMRPLPTWQLDGSALLGVGLPEITTTRAGADLTLGLLWGSRRGDSSAYRLQLEGERATVPLAELAVPPSAGYLRQEVRLSLPPRLEPGSYRLTLAGDTASLQPRWPPIASSITLGTVAVQSRTRLFEPPQPGQLAAATFGDPAAPLAELVGYDLLPGPDDTELNLYWHALADGQARFKVFAHCLDAQGALVTQSDAEPDAGLAPTDSWLSGEYVIDHHRLPTTAACTQVRVGLYGADGARLFAASPSLEVADDAVTLLPEKP